MKRLLGQLAGRTDLNGLILKSGKPGMFIAGADLKELGGANPESRANPGLHPARPGCRRIVSKHCHFPPPSYRRRLHGRRHGVGAGLRLFAWPARTPRREIGLPEVKIGLIPGWGGTQRLTRLIGPSLAAEIICSGDAVKAKRAAELGIVFDVVPSDRLQSEAVRLLADLQAAGTWQAERAKRRQPVGLSEEQMQFTFAAVRGFVLEKTKGQLPAPLAALDAIAKGCNLPLEDGLKVETEAFVPLVGSPISRNLIAVFFMSQRLQKDPGVDVALQPRPVKRVGVLGAGIMGAGIAGAHVRRGIPAVILDSTPPALEKGVAGIAAGFKGRVEIGRMTARRSARRPGAPQHHDDAGQPGRPRRGHRGHRRERGGQDGAVQRVEKRCCGPTRSWPRTLRRSPLRAWPALGKSPNASPACTSSTRWIACSWSR